jgi:hypothetical protein
MALLAPGRVLASIWYGRGVRAPRETAMRLVAIEEHLRAGERPVGL